MSGFTGLGTFKYNAGKGNTLQGVSAKAFPARKEGDEWNAAISQTVGWMMTIVADCQNDRIIELILDGTITAEGGWDETDGMSVDKFVSFIGGRDSQLDIFAGRLPTVYRKEVEDAMRTAIATSKFMRAPASRTPSASSAATSSSPVKKKDGAEKTVDAELEAKAALLQSFREALDTSTEMTRVAKEAVSFDVSRTKREFCETVYRTVSHAVTALLLTKVKDVLTDFPDEKQTIMDQQSDLKQFLRILFSTILSRKGGEARRRQVQRIIPLIAIFTDVEADVCADVTIYNSVKYAEALFDLIGIDAERMKVQLHADLIDCMKKEGALARAAGEVGGTALSTCANKWAMANRQLQQDADDTIEEMKDKMYKAFVLEHNELMDTALQALVDDDTIDDDAKLSVVTALKSILTPRSIREWYEEVDSTPLTERFVISLDELEQLFKTHYSRSKTDPDNKGLMNISVKKSKGAKPKETHATKKHRGQLSQDRRRFHSDDDDTNKTKGKIKNYKPNCPFHVSKEFICDRGEECSGYHGKRMENLGVDLDKYKYADVSKYKRALKRRAARGGRGGRTTTTTPTTTTSTVTHTTTSPAPTTDTKRLAFMRSLSQKKKEEYEVAARYAGDSPWMDDGARD
nr:hypothetical protein [Dehalococcoidia bacterium]